MAYVSTELERAERKARRAAIVARAKALQAAGAAHNVAVSITGKQYSTVNQYLIAAQNGAAGVYGGFHSWKAQGRKVKKGGRGVVIYAPIMKKPDGSLSTVSDAPEKVAMTTACVFHLDQTEPITA